MGQTIRKEIVNSMAQADYDLGYDDAVQLILNSWGIPSDKVRQQYYSLLHRYAMEQASTYQWGIYEDLSEEQKGRIDDVIMDSAEAVGWERESNSGAGWNMPFHITKAKYDIREAITKAVSERLGHGR